jgi:PAS domain S-box-containing protein
MRTRLLRTTHRHRDELKVRASQQAAVAELGQRALGGLDLLGLLGGAADAARGELGTDYATVLQLTSDRRSLLVRAAAGFPDDALGGVLRADAEELAGHALEGDGPVVIEDLAGDPRFQPSPAQRELGVVSAMVAPIGVRGRRFGVIGVYSASLRSFSGDDVQFLRALANVLGLAVERSRHEELVRDSEARFRELADTTPALMWTTDADGHVTFVNEGWLRFTGRRLEEELGDTFGLSAHSDDRAELLARWRDAFRRREEFRFEYRLIHAQSGGHRWVLEVGTPRFTSGEFAGYVGTSTDIHERRAMEEALRVSEASFRDLADTAPVMIWTTDTEGLVTFVNEGWMRFTGTTLDEELGSSWALGVHPDDVEDMLASWDAALAERSVWEFEYRLMSSGGDYRWIVDRGVPRYERGRFVGYVGAAVDIHERVLLQDRLRERYEIEHMIAETLQRSLLPERLPKIEGLELMPRYLPSAGRGAAIGGDWYDALERPDGRVALVVGDVAGHGLRAAAAMGQLRNSFRAYGLVESSPAEVVARVNRLATSGGEEAMATVLYLILDRDTGEVTFSAAGHPPPLLLAPDGPRFLEGGRSVPIGAADPAVFREASAVLPPGSALLLYTDGLVERRGVPLEESLDALAAAVDRAEDDLDRLCDRVLDAVLPRRDPVDDVALLAVRPTAMRVNNLRLSLPAEPESLAMLRRRLERFLHAAGASELESYEITLTICEAAGNAIEHAYGPGDASFEVEAELIAGELVASVRDGGRWRERRGEHRGRGLKIIIGLMDDVDIRTEDGGTLVTMRRRLAEARAA